MFVVSTDTCPNHDLMVLISTPACSRWVAVVWRMVCGDTRLSLTDGILLFVSVTELLHLAKFSRHAKAQTSLTLVIWLNENILIPTSSFMPFPDEASHTYFFRRKVSASRILQVPGALFLGFFQKLFAVCRASNKNFSGPGVK